MLNRRGAIQSTFVVVISVLTLLALAGTIIFTVKRQIDQRALGRKNAQEAAEYGMMVALKKIEQDPSWSEGYFNVKYKDCFYDVKIEKNADSTYRARATGDCRNVKKRVVCTYRLLEEGGSLKPKTISWEYQ